MKRIRIWSAVLLCASIGVAAAQERAYTEGSVVEVTSVKLVDGQFDNYLAYLDGNWKGTMEAAKKAGLVQDYAVYGASPRRAEDADLYLVVVYPNMATLDGLQAKMDPITAKVSGMTIPQQNEASGKRTVMRNIMGTELLRELKLK